jgi:hypothetical protein
LRWKLVQVQFQVSSILLRSSCCAINSLKSWEVNRY